MLSILRGKRADTGQGDATKAPLGSGTGVRKHPWRESTLRACDCQLRKEKKNAEMFREEIRCRQGKRRSHVQGEAEERQEGNQEWLREP